jgi:hypothetical protein
MGAMLEQTVPDRSSEPIAGWRVWNLSVGPEGSPRLHPVSSDGHAWPPRRAVDARCELPRMLTIGRRQHEAPDPDCRCGIYAARSLTDFERPRPAWPPPSVVGTVSLWGRVIEHESGWRAAHAYPVRLRVVCALCAWFEPGPGDPVTVHRFTRYLYALCADHRGGIQVPDGRRSRPTALDPSELQASLLAAYAVDLLPFEDVEILFRFPPPPERPGWIPTIRVVPPSE